MQGKVTTCISETKIDLHMLPKFMFYRTETVQSDDLQTLPQNEEKNVSESKKEPAVDPICFKVDNLTRLELADGEDIPRTNL